MTVERYLKQHGKLHPTIRKVLQPYFEIDLKSIKVQLIDHTDLIKVTIFVIADTIIVMRGILNFPYISESFDRDGELWHRSNGAVDLSTDAGLKTLGHEIKHCEQWRLTPRWKYWLWYLPGVIAGYIKDKQYAHRFIRWEREAITFQKTLTFSEEVRQRFKAMQ